MTYTLYTESTDCLNGETFEDRDEMVSAVRDLYGDNCDFSITEGFILDGDGQIVATFGETEAGTQ